MRRSAVGLVTVAAVAIAAVATLAVAGDEDVELEQLPPQVRKAVLKAAQGGTIHEIEREREHGRVVYEVEVRFGRREVEFTFDEHGRLLEKEGEHEEHEEAEEAEEEHEERVSPAEVPKAALAALRKLAGDREIVELTREREHGHVFYEGSWKTRQGRHVDTLVTPDGHLVEIEEQVPAADVPPAVLAKLRKLAGEDTRFAFEKKTMILYEAKFRSKGRFHEVLLTPDGRIVSREHEREHEEADEDDDG